MPSVPKWLADAMEKLSNGFYTPVTVSHIHYPAPALKLVRFEGNFSQLQFIAGKVVEFRVSDTDYRHYTPSFFDSDKGICEVLFYLHQQGPGSSWADSLQVGNRLKMIGPGGKMSYQPAFSRHMVFGDETSLGLMEALHQAITGGKQDCLCLAELELAHFSWAGHIQAPLVTVEKSHDNAATHAIGWLGQCHHTVWLNRDQTFFYLTGQARSIQQLNRFLTTSGVSSKQIKTCPYWAEGKKGL